MTDPTDDEILRLLDERTAEASSQPRAAPNECSSCFNLKQQLALMEELSKAQQEQLDSFCTSARERDEQFTQIRMDYEKSRDSFNTNLARYMALILKTIEESGCMDMDKLAIIKRTATSVLEGYGFQLDSDGEAQPLQRRIQ